MKYSKIYKLLDSFAPFSLSNELCALQNGYDNSGAILETDREITSVVFALDLTLEAVEFAKKSGAELIITHHPAIYTPIKKLDGALLKAAKMDIGVISAHLNLDCAIRGIDYFQAKGVGGENCEILFPLSEGGYGRKFSTSGTLGEIFNKVRAEFCTDKARLYGNEDKKIKTVASFCGGGLNIEEANTQADLFISADIRHHVILFLLEKGASVIELTHYASENYGFKKVFSELSANANLKGLKLYYFDDRRL